MLIIDEASKFDKSSDTKYSIFSSIELKKKISKILNSSIKMNFNSKVFMYN